LEVGLEQNGGEFKSCGQCDTRGKVKGGKGGSVVNSNKDHEEVIVGRIETAKCGGRKLLKNRVKYT